MADISKLSPPYIQKIHLLHDGHSMKIFFTELDSSLIDDYVIPKLVELAGGGGKVSRLTNEEVGQEIVNHMFYKKFKQDKANEVGDLEKTNNILCKALCMQVERGSPTKKQNKMGQHAVDILKRSQKVASHKLQERRNLRMRKMSMRRLELDETTDSEDEEDEKAKILCVL